MSLRMGYADSAEEFVRCGQRTAEMLRATMRERGLVLQKGSAVLDWGCATGRVLQHFHREATDCEFWGADIGGGPIAWAKEHFSPPFHFVTCTVYPHLPFEDRKFCFIYGCSVFTHIRHLTDCWLMELNRVLRPGGMAVFTILDEHSVQWFREHNIDQQIMPLDFDLNSLTAHDEVFFSGDNWPTTFSFYKSDWIRKSWGRYFDVLDIKPEAEDYQTVVVLGKPSR
jgi:ubiquinone/menaquinone biosynthesis C-methylase UbiE